MSFFSFISFLLGCLHAFLFWTCFWQRCVFWLEQMLCLDPSGIVLVWLKQCVWVRSAVLVKVSLLPLWSVFLRINALAGRGAIQATLPDREQTQLWTGALGRDTVSFMVWMWWPLFLSFFFFKIWDADGSLIKKNLIWLIAGSKWLESKKEKISKKWLHLCVSCTTSR